MTVTREGVVRFAERYDLQPLHTGEAGAVETMYDGSRASGWQTAALTARLRVEPYVNERASAGGTSPPCAGTRPSGRHALGGKGGTGQPPERRAAFGHTRISVTTTNEDGETVLTMEGLGPVKRRERSENEPI